MNDYGVAGEFGRRLVQRVHHDLLADELRGWRGEHGDFAKQLDAANFSLQQRRLMWRYAVGLAEAAVYRVVHFLDEEVENERLTLHYQDPALPEDTWEGHLDNAHGFASDMFARHGVDFEKRYAGSEPGRAC